MNQLVAAYRHPHHPLQHFLKSLAGVFAAALCFSGSASAAGSSSVSLAWDPNPETDIAGYRLQYGLTPGSYPIVVDAGKTTSATAQGLNQGTTYYFTVVAYNSAGQASAPSPEISYVVPGTPNTAPSAASFSLTVAEDGEVSAIVSGTDAEGDILGYSIVSAPTKGTLSGIAPNFTYRPAANANGSDSFTYRASDGALNSSAATVSISITPVNDAPVASAKNVTVQEDGQVAVTLSGTDVDGDSLAYAIVSAPTKGTLTGTAPNLTYRPAANIFGSDSFTYRVSDGTANSATATVSITISSVNDAPVANSQTLTMAEDSSLPITLTGSDVEGSSLTYAVVSQPGKGTLSGSPPNLVYTPAANFNGADSFTFRVNDGSTNSATSTISINVTAVNDVPVALGRLLATTPNTPVAVILAGTDVEGSALSYTIVTQPTNGTLSGTAPNLTYTPKASFAGNDSFTYRVNDGTANSANANVLILVNSTNRAPVAHEKSATTMKNKVVGVTLSGSDADADVLSFRVVNAPAGGTLTGTPPNIKYTPKATWTGNDTFTYVVNDGKTDSAVATVNLKVKAINKRPVATARAVTAFQNTSLPLVVTGTDPDGDNLTYVVVKQPVNGTISGTGPNFVYIPKTGFKGKDKFTFAAFDGMIRSLPAVADITVINPNNRAPVAAAQSVSGPAKKPVTITLRGTDADSDAMTFRLVSKPVGGTITGRAASYIFRPLPTFSGIAYFTYVANDGTVDSAPATVQIYIAPPVTPVRNLAAISNPSGVVGGEAGVAPGLSINRSATGGVALTVTGVPGASYMLEHSESLIGWADLRGVDIPAGGVLELDVTVPAGSKSGFFRLRTPD